MRLPARLERELEGCDWRIEAGNRHKLLYVNGRMIGIIPHGSNAKREKGQRAMLNVIAQIRRAKKETSNGK